MSSLPFLRALLAGMFTKGGRTVLGYRSKRSDPSRSGNMNISYPMDDFAQSKSNTFTTAQHQRSASRSGSEEAILYDDRKGDGIMKTTQVYVHKS
jgi:hypothetical protein